MWIYSLGVTLGRAIHPPRTKCSSQYTTKEDSTRIASLRQQQNGAILYRDVNDSDNYNNSTQTIPTTRSSCEYSTTLDHIIQKMCAANLNKRATLMYLLDVSVYIYFNEMIFENAIIISQRKKSFIF